MPDSRIAPRPRLELSAPVEFEVRFDRVYGIVKCYPASAEAEIFARIAGTKTLASSVLDGARALGFKPILARGSLPAPLEYGEVDYAA